MIIQNNEIAIFFSVNWHSSRVFVNQVEGIFVQHQTAQILKGSQQMNIARKCPKLGKQIADYYASLY